MTNDKHETSTKEVEQWNESQSDEGEKSTEVLDPESPSEKEEDEKEDDEEEEADDKDSEENKSSDNKSSDDDDADDVVDDNENENDDDDDDEEDIIKPTTKKRRHLVLDDEDQEDEEEEEVEKDEGQQVEGDDEKEEDDEDKEKEEERVEKGKKKKNRGSDEDDDDDDDDDDDNDDDDDDEDKEDEEKEKEKDARDDEEQEEEEDEEDDIDRRGPRNDTIYDFDIMMAKKKEENSKRRKRKNYDIINDNDDIIADIINQMKDAVEADSEANRSKMAATRKLKLLPFVISQLRKVDLRDAFLDSDVLSVITEWLAPLPDKSLPHLHIRESLLKILIDFNLYDVDRIKGSGIGKAIMYLYKHPKETRENKQRAKQLISSWSRPIFQLDSSFTAISREEREQRDLELMSKKKRSSKHNDSSDGEGPGPSSSSKRTKEEVGPQKPGEKGWIPRARVPAPSMKDYVIRPRSKVDGDIGKSSRRPSNMLEKYMKNQQDRKRANRQQRAVNMKIDRV